MTTLYGGSLLKSKAILDYLYNASEAPTLTEISAGINVPKATTLKLLKTLIALRFVRRDPVTKQYVLGSQLALYGRKALAGGTMISLARPHLNRLSREVGGTVNIGLVRDSALLLGDKIEGPVDLHLKSVIGSPMPLYSTGMGKVALAHFTPAELTEYLATHELQQLTPFTITDESELRRNLEYIRQTGVGLDNGENEAGIFCVATSIMQDAELAGAFSVSVARAGADGDTQTRLSAAVLETKNAIEASLNA